MTLLCWVTPAPCRADVTDGLYQADAIVTGTDMRQRPWGFAQCLREVLVKVSGDPLLRRDPRVEALAAHADRFVASFGYVDLMAHLKRNDDQGSYDRPHRLTVHFDPAKIDAALAGLGEVPWRGVRPVIVPVLLVQGPIPGTAREGRPPGDSPYVLSAEAPKGAEQRGAFVEAAREYGMTVRLPTERELAAWHIAADRFPRGGVAPPVGRPGEAVVLGTLTWSESLPGWIGQWRASWHGRKDAWGIRGVNYDAAFRDIVAGIVKLAAGRGAP